MVLKTYIFASVGNVFQQYTSDHTDAFLRSVCNSCKTEYQIAIHRDGNLMYYAFAHRVSASELYGLCIVCGEICINLQGLYDSLKQCIEMQAKKGILFKYDEKGVIRKNIVSFAQEPAEIDCLFRYVKQSLDKKDSFWEKLPPEDLSIPLHSKICFSFDEDGISKIVDATRHYHNVFITPKNAIPSSFAMTVARLNAENKKQLSINNSLKNEISKLKNKQRNILWVCVLSFIIFVLGGILYVKVINPNEVTRYQTNDFLYYGPLQNQKPNGEGVAFYLKGDKDGRRYYIGHFVNGERQDSTAMLYYQNGDYFYGTMNGDKFMNGIFYSNSDHSHFEGIFIDNKPYEGTWYNHEESYKLKDGRMK